MTDKLYWRIFVKEGFGNFRELLFFSNNYQASVFDNDLTIENIYIIADFFLGLNSRTKIDAHIYKIQKYLFIQKFLNTFLLTSEIECYWTIKYVIIHYLIENEEDISHIETCLAY